MIARSPAVRRQWRVLSDAFLLRFFENESMASASDLREGFFWVIAALATPGIFMPLYMYFRWAEVAAIRGVPAMRVMVLLDKVIYLELTFIGVGLLTAVIWQALLVDRRDGLILGTLPVRARTVIVAKFAALAAYAGLISLGMHSASTLLYGLGLSSLESFSRLLHFMAGQMAAATAANVFVFACVIGVQSLAVALFGPRRFTRLSSALQVIVIAGVTTLLLLLPFMADGSSSLATWPLGRDGALLWMPPIWFLGLNEVISGSTFPIMSTLASRALVALGVATGLVLVCYPIAAQRTMAAAVTGTGSARTVWTRSVAARLARWLGRDQYERGAAQLMLSAIARSHQQRLILAVAAGVGITMVAPAVLMYFAGTNIDIFGHYWDRHGPMSHLQLLHVFAHYTDLHTPPVSLSLIAAPLLFGVAIAAGLRTAIAVPSELPAAWPFATTPIPMFAGRNAIRRFMWLVTIALPLAVAMPVWWHTWGWHRAWPLTIACLLGMFSLVDLVLWGYVGIPCAKPLTTSRSNLISRWPLLLAFLYFYAYVFPSWQVGFSIFPGPQYMLIPPTLIWLGVRRGSWSAAYANGMSGDPHGHITLDLSTTAARSGVRINHANQS